MGITDLTGLSQPITKLIEVVSQGIGKIYEPTHVVKMAKAKATEMQIIQSAIKSSQFSDMSVSYQNGEVAITQSLLQLENLKHDVEFIKSTYDRFLYRELKRQQNIDKVVDVAFEEMKDEESVSADKVDNDWVTRFFNYAQDISEESMQTTWGKILSGEIKNPRTFSLQSLDILRNITSSDALIFSKFAKFAFRTGFGSMDICAENQEFLKSQFDLHYNEFICLTDLGLINPKTLYLDFNFTKYSETEFKIGKKTYIVKPTNEGLIASLHVWVFSKAGSELLNLVDTDLSEEYVEHVISLLISKGCSVTLVDQPASSLNQ